MLKLKQSRKEAGQEIQIFFPVQEFCYLQLMDIKDNKQQSQNLLWKLL